MELKQKEALVYLMNEAQSLALVCAQQLVHPNKPHVALEQQLGKLMSSLKEIVLEFEIDGDRLEFSADQEWETRTKK